jgi:hypothetical protein
MKLQSPLQYKPSQRILRIHPSNLLPHTVLGGFVACCEGIALRCDWPTSINRSDHRTPIKANANCEGSIDVNNMINPHNHDCQVFSLPSKAWRAPPTPTTRVQASMRLLVSWHFVPSGMQTIQGYAQCHSLPFAV